MQSFIDASAGMTQGTYMALKTALELGKWPTGSDMTQTQKETCLSAIIAYEAKNLPENDRLGFMPKKDCRSD